MAFYSKITYQTGPEARDIRKFRLCIAYLQRRRGARFHTSITRSNSTLPIESQNTAPARCREKMVDAADVLEKGDSVRGIPA